MRHDLVDRVGLRVPLLMSAAGRAYFAFSKPPDREAILENLRHSVDPNDRCARDDLFVRDVLRFTLERGYGVRHRELFSRTGAIGVPVMHAGRIMCCLSMTYIASALTAADAARKYLAPLRETASRIEQALAKEACPITPRASASAT